MNILFIYSIQKSIAKNHPLKGQEEIQLGISYISSLLKKSNHNTDLIILDRKYKNSNHKTIDQKIKSFSPSLVCFSAVNTEFDFILEMATYTKQQHPNIFLLLGGVHITLNPEDKYLDIFNALCIGEGEYPNLELADKLENNVDISDIPNLWVIQNNQIVKNATRSFIRQLDELPFPDREIWQPLVLERNSRQVILLGRGCPYNCTYCSNHKLKKVSEGNYVRLRSPLNIIQELENLTNNFPKTHEVFFEIETLGIDVNWLKSLCELLSEFNSHRQTKISFSANLRVNPGMDFDFIFNILKTAGFDSIIIGLESGNERIRKEILNRNYSNETFLEAVKAARKHNLKLGIFNLIGLPTETYSDFLDTLHLNQLIQPNWHATSIFFPYAGTTLYEKTKQLNLLPTRLNTKDERQHAILDLPGFSKKQIQKSFDSFHYNVYKKSPHKNPLKLILYFIQTFLGHNFMANSKLFLIKMLYKFRIKNLRLISIFQKT